jgi:hypothetical protein
MLHLRRVFEGVQIELTTNECAHIAQLLATEADIIRDDNDPTWKPENDKLLTFFGQYLPISRIENERRRS